MESGGITSYIDVAQVALYGFWIFFAGLIFYLRREDKREGYPLETDLPLRQPAVGFPWLPEPKTFTLAHGGTASAPRPETDSRQVLAEPYEAWPGAPLDPTGNPMLDAVGPASYALRADVPDLTYEGEHKIVPLRVASDFWIEERDPQPVGMEVIGADGMVAGTVQDVWVDRSEFIVRYYEVEVTASGGARRVLLPNTFCRIDGQRRRILVQALLADQFADVPGLQNPDQVTFREEDRITAYYGGGTLYATRARREPML